jgi:hypothetical protein
LPAAKPDRPAPFPPSGGGSSLARVRTMFTAYWVVILGGIVLYLLIGVTHN